MKKTDYIIPSFYKHVLKILSKIRITPKKFLIFSNFVHTRILKKNLQLKIVNSFFYNKFILIF